MSDYYLDFELPLKEIDQKILELESDPNSKNTSEDRFFVIQVGNFLISLLKSKTFATPTEF